MLAFVKIETGPSAGQLGYISAAAKNSVVIYGVYLFGEPGRIG